MSKQGKGRKRQQPPQAPPPFETTKAEYFRYVYASGAMGNVSPKGANIIFYLDRIEPESLPGRPGAMRVSKINQELQVEVHMSPVEFKSFGLWVANQVRRYEERFGEITGPPADEDENPLVQ